MGLRPRSWKRSAPRRVIFKSSWTSYVARQLPLVSSDRPLLSGAMSGNSTITSPGGLRGIAVLLALTHVLTACARPSSPPGGPRDGTGPQVVETVPDTFAVVEAFDDAIRITFDERISERASTGSLEGAVQISPESGEIQVRHGSRDLEITMEGGFRSGLVYRVTVLPVVRDLFQNVMADAFEFVFSTGAEMTPNAMAGTIFDRLTERVVEGARVTARIGGPGDREGDDGVPTHVAITDTGGVYAFRYMPSGEYVLTAFVDQNRNREADDFEQIGTGFQSLGQSDTVFADLSLLRPDTSAAVLASADVVDSLTLTVRFDDFLDPDFALTGVSASLASDSVDTPAVVEILQERDYLVRMEALEDSLRTLDSIRAERLILEADSLRNAGDSAAAAELETGELQLRSRSPARRRPDPARDLPKQVLYLLLGDTLIVDQPYELTVGGVTNINGIGGGGGSTEILRVAPEVDSSLVADSIPPGDGEPPEPDTLRPDTSGVVRVGVPREGGFVIPPLDVP